MSSPQPLELPRPEPGAPVVLRPLSEEDVPAYVKAFVDDADLGRLLGVEADPEPGSLRARIGRMPGLREQGQFLEAAITAPPDDAFLGSLTVHTLDWKNRRGEIGFWVVPAARGRGLCEAAVRTVLPWLFEEIGLERIEVTTTTDNDAAGRLARKLGFVYEGILRGRNLERGRRIDLVFFGLLRDDWRSSRAAAAS